MTPKSTNNSTLHEKISHLPADEYRLYMELSLRHQGHDKAITAAALAVKLETNERHVRDMVASLRRLRIPICSDTTGLWLPVSREDAAPSIGWIVHRFQPLRAAYEGLMGGLEDYFGAPSFDIAQADIGYPGAEAVSSALPAPGVSS